MIAMSASVTEEVRKASMTVLFHLVKVTVAVTVMVIVLATVTTVMVKRMMTAVARAAHATTAA